VPGDAVRVLLAEIKQGHNVPTQALMNQIREYYEVFSPAGRLRDCLAQAYTKVTSQKEQLGLLSPATRFPDVPPQVECLLLLCNRGLTSKLLLRLRTAARAARFEARLVCLPNGRHALPPPQDWIAL